MTEAGPPTAPPKLWAMLQATDDSKSSPVEAGTHTPEQIADMLKHLDAENYRNREAWLTIMMACHHASGAAARQEFIDWSTTDPWYTGDASSIGETWDSLHVKSNRKPVTVATLYAELHKHGHGGKIAHSDVTKDFENVEEEPHDEFRTKIQQLALLSEVEYDRVREEEAEQLDIRVSTLDKEVKKARQGQVQEQKKLINFADVEPWQGQIDGAELLTEIAALVQRFIICDVHVARAVTLWIAFTWLINEVRIAPLAIITAPEKRCGKSQLLALISMLCYRPLIASNISSAAIYRVVEAYGPTLIIDEADTFLKENEEARGIINSGHTRQTAYVLRLIGDEHEPKQFKTWGAKAISGIGYMPETLMDRAVVLELRRKLPEEKVERLRHAELKEFNVLKSKLARFAKDAAEAIRSARPDLPEELNDRAQDNWEPLIAIADYAGDKWAEAARKTALAISADKDTLSTSWSAQLLADIREIFQSFLKRKISISTEEMLEKLNDDNTKPWHTYNRGRPMTPRQLARLLEPYGVKGRVLRHGYTTKRGYKAADFEDAFTRYLPPHEGKA